MDKNRIRFYSAWVIISAFILLSGCAGLNPGRPDCHTKQAFKLANSVKDLNKNIKSCTGIGWIRISTKKRTDKFRIAWVALNPDKIRLTLLDTGFPVETIIADGEKVIFISHTGKHSLYKINTPNPSLMAILSIPVKVRGIISLLSGRIPLKNFNSACLSGSDNSGKMTLILNEEWRGMSQKIIFDPKGLICKYELLDSEKWPLYSVSLAKFKTYGISRIPLKIKITDASGRDLELEITDYRVNTPVKNSAFSLTESG